MPALERESWFTAGAATEATLSDAVSEHTGEAPNKLVLYWQSAVRLYTGHDEVGLERIGLKRIRARQGV